MASYIVEDEPTMNSTRLEKIRNPANAANPLVRVPEHRLVRQPTNNDKLSATCSRWYRYMSIVQPLLSILKLPRIPLAANINAGTPRVFDKQCKC
jgi:hypothetical protein